MRTKAQIRREDEVILEQVDVFLNVAQGPTLSSWDGHFDTSEAIVGLVNGKFTLVLEDGRSGVFFVTNISIGVDGEAVVDFQGTGPLR